MSVLARGIIVTVATGTLCLSAVAGADMASAGAVMELLTVGIGLVQAVSAAVGGSMES